MHGIEWEGSVSRQAPEQLRVADAGVCSVCFICPPSPFQNAVVATTLLTSLTLTLYHQQQQRQQVCDYLMEGDTPEAAVEQGQQLLGLSALQASQVVAAEAPAQMQAVKGVAVSGGSGSGGPGGCGNAVMGAAAAGVAAAVAVALAYLNLGQ